MTDETKRNEIEAFARGDELVFGWGEKPIDKLDIRKWEIYEISTSSRSTNSQSS